MQKQQTHPTARSGRAEADEVAVLTDRALEAMDTFADELMNQHRGTPETLPGVLQHVLSASLDELCDALEAIDERRGERAQTLKPAQAGVFADGWRTQLPGWWPYRPDEPHSCHTSGHWTRDGRTLVLACCGLDAT